MPNTAGFDVVLELSRGFLEDTFYSAPRSLFPNGDVNDTFAPPFSWPFSFSGINGSGDAQLIVDQAYLLGLPGSADVLFRFVFSFPTDRS